METKPILFSGEMVRAILDGRKTQTRRAVKTGLLAHSGLRYQGLYEDLSHVAFLGERSGEQREFKNPYGKPGNRLWVRETWSAVEWEGEDEPKVYYKADPLPDRYEWSKANGDKWRPSIHMPRWASRITLKITDIRVERVQEISLADINAEGIHGDTYPELGLPCSEDERSAQIYFMELWNSINAKRGYGWKVNPWVWVISFKKLDQGLTTKAG